MMKHSFLMLSAAAALTLAACGETHNDTEQVIDTKDMYRNADSASGVAGMSPADSSADSSAKPYVPGSDNPRKVDMAGTPHPDDTAGGRKGR